MSRASSQQRSNPDQVLSHPLIVEAIEDEFEAENARADAKKLRFDSDGRFPMGQPMQATSKDTALPGDPKGNQNG